MTRLGYTQKMPGTTYGLPATACKLGSKLVDLPGSVCHGCYALKGTYTYPNVQKGQERRLKDIEDPGWVAGMAYELNGIHGGLIPPVIRFKPEKWSPGWHRWHDSGDIQSVKHLDKIVQVCRLTPTIRHWLPTRELSMVRQWIRSNVAGALPENLIVRVSGTMIDGPPPKSWPWTSTVTTGVPTCPDECKNCRKCWDKSVKNIAYSIPQTLKDEVVLRAKMICTLHNLPYLATWKKMDGQKIKIIDMEKSHIQNVLAMIARRSPLKGNIPEQGEAIVKRLELELTIRKMRATLILQHSLGENPNAIENSDIFGTR